jgi:hypothetical protein
MTFVRAVEDIIRIGARVDLQRKPYLDDQLLGWIAADGKGFTATPLAY